MSWWQTCQYPVNQPVLLVSGFPLQLLPGADNLELCINPNDDHMSESEYSSDLFTLHYDRCSILSHAFHLGQIHSVYYKCF